MDNQPYSPAAGNQSLALTVILSIFTWMSPEQADFSLKALTAIAALVAAIFSIRYYKAARKAAKAEQALAEEELKRLRDE